jgi:hypothetical protein
MEDIDVSLDDILPLLDSIFCDFRNALRRGFNGLDGTAGCRTDNNLALLDVSAEADENFLEDLFRQYCVAESQVEHVRSARQNPLPMAVLRSGGRTFAVLPVNLMFLGILRLPRISEALHAEKSILLPEQTPTMAQSDCGQPIIRDRSDGTQNHLRT